MTASRVGEVVSVEFPFTDMQGRKRRPGVVLAGDAVAKQFRYERRGIAVIRFLEIHRRTRPNTAWCVYGRGCAPSLAVRTWGRFWCCGMG